MNRTFWAGFGVAMIVIILPTLILIDARSSSDPPVPRGGISPAAGPQPPPPSASSMDTPFPPESSLLPGRIVPALPPDSSGKGVLESRISPKALARAGAFANTIQNPEIVFSPERVRKSLEKDRDRRSHPRIHRRSRSGIREIVYDPKLVTTIRTAVSHVTLIDLPEEAKEVYLGDSKLFLAEVFGSRVKIKPITWDSGTTTNMIVYTVHKQFAFRLEVVSEGEEDDLLTFYSPKSETVVNLNPIRVRMERALARKEKTDLHEEALSTLAAAGPSVPFHVEGVREGVTGIFLGFSSLGESVYALFELRNDTGRQVFLTDIRLRMFRTSLFWDGRKEWIEGQDFRQAYRVDIPPHQSRRALLLAALPPLRSAREGYRADLRVEGGEGKRRFFHLEARGGRQ
jgi:hypothetical protein